MIFEVLCGFIVVSAAIIIAATIDICRMRKSESHTMSSLLHQYFVQLCLQVVGTIMHWKLNQDTGNCRKLQEKFLLRILRENENTVYGRTYYFDKITCKEEFIKFHPVTRYNHYKEYVDRIAKGEGNVLTAKKPLLLAVTSGTSGNSNIIPMTKDIFATFFLYGIAILSYCMVTTYPQVRQLQRVLKFFYTPKQRHSAAGIPIGPSSSSPANSRSILPLYSTPQAGYEILTEPEALYVHLLFALKDRNLGMIEANFASLVHHGFLSLQREWQNLVDDIRFGRTNPNLDIPTEIRIRLDALLKPDPRRAKELEEEFIVGFEGISKRIWPNMNLVLATDTGSMKLYGEVLKTIYTKGLNHYSPLYAATEGLIGVNIWPSEPNATYLLVPRSMFFEFIPIEDADNEQPQTFFTEQVKEGGIYELVISTVNGLYRYRIGDVIRIVKFLRETPVVEFLYRYIASTDGSLQGQLLNVHGEKISEQIFYEALVKSLETWKNNDLIDYCCAESGLLCNLQDFQDGVISPLPHYLVFVEVDGKGQLSDIEKNQVDENLMQNHWVYKSYRNKGGIAPACVHVVRRGTFQELRCFMVETTGCSPNQVKIPRVIRSKFILKFLWKHKVDL